MLVYRHYTYSKCIPLLVTGIKLLEWQPTVVAPV